MIQFSNQNTATGIAQLDLALVQREQRNTEWDETDFLITFCKAIGYDKMGLQNQAKHLVNHLYDHLDHTPDNSSQEIFMTDEEYKEAFFFMSGLTSFASSKEIQTELQSLVSKLAFEGHSTLEFATAPNLIQNDWKYARWNPDQATIEFCKESKFVKRWRHIFRKVREVLFLVKEAKDLINDIEKTFN